MPRDSNNSIGKRRGVDENVNEIDVAYNRQTNAKKRSIDSKKMPSRIVTRQQSANAIKEGKRRALAVNDPNLNTEDPDTTNLKEEDPETANLKAANAKNSNRKTANDKATNTMTENDKTPKPKTSNRKTTSTETSNDKTPTRKSPTRTTPTPKTPTRTISTRTTPTRKTPTRKTPTRTTPTSKTPTPKTLAPKTPAPKTSISKTPTRKTTSTKTSDDKTPTRKIPTRKMPTHNKQNSKASELIEPTPMERYTLNLSIDSSPTTKRAHTQKPTSSSLHGKESNQLQQEPLHEPEYVSPLEIMLDSTSALNSKDISTLKASNQDTSFYDFQYTTNRTLAIIENNSYMQQSASTETPPALNSSVTSPTLVTDQEQTLLPTELDFRMPPDQELTLEPGMDLDDVIVSYGHPLADSDTVDVWQGDRYYKDDGVDEQRITFDDLSEFFNGQSSPTTPFNSQLTPTTYFNNQLVATTHFNSQPTRATQSNNKLSPATEFSSLPVPTMYFRSTTMDSEKMAGIDNSGLPFIK